MDYQFNFGVVKNAASRPAGSGTQKFRIALLGDFSGGANLGRLETGAELAKRKPLRVDCDNLDATIARLKIKLALPIGPDGGTVELKIGSMDDFHPEQLYSNLDIFSELSGLRQRLKTTSTFAKAAAELQSWAGKIPVPPVPAGAGAARGSVIAVDAKLSDFSRLIGRASNEAEAETPIKDLLKQMVAPYVVAAKDPRQDAMLASVDEALGGTMRSILHHPDFQALEALWRSVDFIIRRLETDESLQIVLYDISAEELASDISKTDELEKSGLYQLLIEQPASDAHQGAFSAFVGLYTFERTPPHAELLGRIAKLVSLASAPFLAAIGADCLDQDPKDIHPLIKDSWAALGELQEAGYLGLVAPRFLLRLPYGEKTEPVDCFDFEEFKPKTGLRGMLWGNPAVIAALLLGQTFSEHGSKMKLGTVLGVGEMPFYYFTDKDGDQIALPCTERLMTGRMASLLTTQSLIPLVCMKGAPEVRLGGFGSLAGHELGGPWAPIAIVPAAPASRAKPKTPEPKEEPSAETSELDAMLGDLADKTDEKQGEEPRADTSELDAMLGDLAGNAEEKPVEETPAETPEPAASETSELDALLGDLADKTEEKQAEAEAAEIDPELAALLADLG